MIDLISSLFHENDYIKLVCNNPSREVEGTIVKLFPSAIAIKTTDGKTCGIKGDDIDYFEQGGSPETSGSKSSSTNAVSSDNSPILSVPDDTEHLDDAQKQSSTTSESIAPTKEYRPGDKIDLNVLEKMDPKGTQNRKNLFKSGEKLKTLGTGLEALGALVVDEHKEQNQKVVPANGEIKAIYKDRNFGFIRDGRTQKDVFFNMSQVVDKNLKSSILSHTPVVYSIINGEQGEKANCIHKPGKVSDLLSMVNELAKEGELKQSIAVIDHILAEYPNNFAADKLRSELTKKIAPYYVNTKEYSDTYNKAKKYHSAKQYDKAIEYYLKTIEKGQKTESAIKDLAMLYAFLYKTYENEANGMLYKEKAQHFIDQYKDKLSDTTSTFYYLENFYYSIKDFDNCISVINRLTDYREIYEDKSRLILLLSKKAACLLRLNQIEESRNEIEQILSYDSQNASALKLLSIIENPESQQQEDIDSIISATSFDSLTSGLSSFIQQTIDNYEEYTGVPAKIIESQKFDEQTLRSIRSKIDTFTGIARERSKYLLTEVKLMRLIEPDNLPKLRSEMAKYCNSMALNHIADNSPLDVIRFYYCESFALEERFEPERAQIPLYLYTHTHSYAQLLNTTSNVPSTEESLSKMLQGDFDAKKWESILSMFLYNREISARVSAILYSKTSLKEKALSALKHFGVEKTDHISSKEEFVAAWNTARDKRLRDYKKVVATINSIGNAANIEELVSLMNNLRSAREDWIPSLDLSRINTILNNVIPALENFLRSSGYRNKESNYNNAEGQLRQLIEEINNWPSKISFEALLPLINEAKQMLKDSFADVIRLSEPKITIKLLSSNPIADGNNLVSLQISISNHRDSSPVREVSVKGITSDDVSFINEDNTLYNAIEGGEEYIFRLKAKISSVAIKNKATVIEAVCRYKSTDEFKEVTTQLSLKLYSPEDFKPIENPYAPIADGGPVPVDSKMFYGREEFITNIVDSIIKSPSKQIIIYGQKRCGKSSVLLHLKKSLIDTGKTFCVSFSIGDIINNLTEVSFYHKILSSIKNELELLEFDGEKNVPKFDIPNLSAFKEEDEYNPLNTFTHYMTLFKMSCKRTEGWEEKRLIVMIDEFTYLYTEIKNGHISPTIMKQWKAVTQNERAQFSVVLVGQDVVPSFKKEDYARNAFGVIQDIRLTYLQDGPARELIEKPILNENGESRYIGNAVSRIIEYTSRNPYYIQIFCSRLVDYMNSNKSINVTEADVNDVATSFIYGDQALEEDKFDNLIRAGETEDLQEYPEEEILSILRQISVNSKNIGFCNRSDIDVLANKEIENSILKNLVEREVLELKGENNYRIQVKLFQEWLLNH